MFNAIEVESRSAHVCTGITKPRILFLIDELSIKLEGGGTERQVLQLVEIAKNSNLEPELWVLRGSEMPPPELTKCTVVLLNIKTLSSFAGLNKLLRTAARMRARRFKILHLFFWEANLIGPWLGRLAGIPTIFGTRRNLTDSVRVRNLGALSRCLSLLTAHLVDEVLSNSRAVLESVRATENLPSRKMRVVYNGIDPSTIRLGTSVRSDTRRQLRVEDDEILVGNVSSLRPVKGIDLFVDAAEIIHKLFPKLKFLIAGDGELREALLCSISERNLQGVVLSVGAVDDVRPYLAAMDIAVLCSRAEGFSNSLLEYMAAGLPIVATDVGGNREALGEAGVLVQADDATELAEEIIKMIPIEQRSHHASAALRAVERFHLKAAEKEMRGLYWGYLERISRAQREGEYA
jgi:glycosyltransferase involved in cell wall biosynthesis